MGSSKKIIYPKNLSLTLEYSSDGENYTISNDNHFDDSFLTLH